MAIKSEIDKRIDAIFSADTKTGTSALVLMSSMVEDLAATRNSDPMRRFIAKAKVHAHLGFANVMGKLIRCYFGEKMVIAVKDYTHPTGFKIKLKFKDTPVARNGWSLVKDAVTANKAYNDREFLKNLNAYLAPAEAAAATIEQAKVKAAARAKTLVKFLEEVEFVGLEEMINLLREAAKEEGFKGPQGGTFTVETTDALADVIELDTPIADAA